VGGGKAGSGRGHVHLWNIASSQVDGDLKSGRGGVVSGIYR